MKYVFIYLIVVGCFIVGCQQEQVQDPKTAAQMAEISEWSARVNDRFLTIDNNMLYLRQRISDPNTVFIDPNAEGKMRAE